MTSLHEESIRQALAGDPLVGREVRVLPEVGSTNDYLKEAARGGAPEGLAVLAERQTAGKGRLGRSFQSPAGLGLWMSVLLRPTCPPERLPAVTALTAAACAEAIREVCGAEAGIKWPNDLVLGGRKLCGILTELEWEAESGEFSCVIIGAGINVSQDEADFGPEVAPIAISLAQALGTAPDRTELAAQVIRSLNALYDDFPAQNAAYLDHFRRDCLTVGNPIKVISGAGERIGTATGISDDFGLTVRWEDGSTETLTSGEVSVRGLYDYV